MLFPRDFPEKLRSTILASEVIGKKVKLKLQGKEFIGLCPFHNEKTPSFSVNDQKGFYHCFGCQAHGDLISFVMNIEGLDYRDAVIKLASDFGIPVPKVKYDNVKEDKVERDYLVLEKIARFFENNLYGNLGSEARDYLRKRMLSSVTAKKFRIGFALNSYENLTAFLKLEGFSEAELLRSGVIGKSNRGSLYDKFRNRIIFPIADRKNRVIAFGGRVIGNDMPKYLNSSETEIFKKNQTLYNSSLARKAIFSKGYVVVVEGYMDAITLFSNGIENVVSGLGTALGAEHLKQLFYSTDKVVICLDGDSAGMRAAHRVAGIALPLINARKNVFFAFLPNQMDPDDFIKEFGAKELEKIFMQAVPLSESLFEFALMELTIDKNKNISAESKAKLEANLDSKVSAINDTATKKYFSLFFKDMLFALGRKQKKILTNFNQKIYSKPAKGASENLAKNIIAFIIKFPELAHFRDNQFDVAHLQLSDEKLTHFKDLLVEFVEDGEESPIKMLEKLEFSSSDLNDIKNILARLDSVDLELGKIKFRILLLKDLLLQVELQYKDTLSRIDEIETHETAITNAITNQKIKEIFDYKTFLESTILDLEKKII